MSIKKNFVKSIFQEWIKNYLNTNLKKIEFIVCIIVYAEIAIILLGRTISSDSVRFLGQLHAFIALYFAYRFGFLGLCVILSFSLSEITYITFLFAIDKDAFLLPGLTSKFITCLSTSIVSVLSNNQEIQKQKLEKLAITDELTDVYNLRHFNEKIDKIIEESKSGNTSVGLIFIDIDNFKNYNDIYGHTTGDKVLKSTASIIKYAVNYNHCVYRYGGDEFAVLLPNADLSSTKIIADNIKHLFEEQKNSYFGESLGKQITLSMGLSEYPNMALTIEELIQQADMALYHSKNLGKNKIHFYQDVISRIRRNISSDHQNIISVFKTLLSTISAKDRYTHGHSERVSNYACMIGEELKMSLSEIYTLQYAGLLHDIGKIEIPKSILNKTGKLSNEEYEIIKLHPVYSANILEPLEEMDQLIDFVKHHHEKFDGSGYPNGLSGKEISLGARIICIADSFDAMLSKRPYSTDMKIDEALNELIKSSGTHFDPLIVEVFVKIVRQNKELF